MLQSAARRDQLDLELLRRYHDRQDIAARDEMVERAMPLVRSLARRYRDRGEVFEDLVQVGALGLVKAIDRFDPYAGKRFISFAAPTITGEIKRHFRDHCWALHVPRATQELAARLQSARGEIADRTGTEPTAAELAEVLEAPVQDVQNAIAASRSYRAGSLERPGADGGAVQVLDAHGSEDEGYAHVDDRELVERACSVLDDRARRIVRDRFVEERLQREIAEDVGVSQMQISRIVTKSLDRMRGHLEDQGIERPQALAA
jgi:RNA polymerase sigma-B factor